ncbi:SCYL2 [Acanthosepion pharaonis]|uniref:SCYL2 n=1 Tax=Acanthosepion pharaonis TaxID=158019 RepID=A0A812ENK5_ACAPH|nr:SCYL2 [Sepia pharaonis]
MFLCVCPFLPRDACVLLSSNSGNFLSTSFFPECDFIEIEIKYGILQIAEALCYLHVTEQMMHRNISPQSILLTKRGGWKMAGLGFAEKALKDGKDTYLCQPWTTKLPKMAQPDLNYMAPEILTDKTCTSLSDIFSLGMVVCSVYNSGKPLIEAEHSVSLYLKKLDQVILFFFFLDYYSTHWYVSLPFYLYLYMH